MPIISDWSQYVLTWQVQLVRIKVCEMSMERAASVNLCHYNISPASPPVVHSGYYMCGRVLSLLGEY